MAKARVLTQAFLDSIKPTDKREEHADLKQPGLRLIVQPSNARSWAIRYRNLAGKSAKLTIGPWPALDLATARRKAAKARASLADDVDPAQSKRAAKLAAREAAASTLDIIENVVSAYVERYAKRQTRERSWRETERILKREVVGTWRGRRLSSITRAQVHDLLDRIVDRPAPILANRTRGALRHLYAWAEQRGLVDDNPVAKVERPSAEVSRERMLSDVELKALWTATEALGYPVGPMVRMLVLCGQRLRETAGMRWSEVDLAARLWTLPAQRSKNGRENQIPLSPQAVAILESLPRFEGCDFIFTTRGEVPLNYFTEGKRRLDATMRAAHWTMHDLRRTAASGMAGLGIAPHVVEAVLNHKSGVIRGVAAVYNRFSYGPEKRAALERWAQHVERLVTGSEAENVVELAGRR